MSNPLPSGVDLRRVFASSQLEGLWGLRPVPAEEDWMCGAAAVTTVLNHLLIHVNQHHVCDGTQTTRQTGTPYKGILKYVSAKRLRCTATKETPADAIRGYVRERRYALLDWGDWPGHWVLVAGWEPAQQVLVLMDPCRREMPFVGMTWAAFVAFWEGMSSPVSRVAIDIRKPKRELKSKKGFEDRTDFRLETWAVVHRLNGKIRERPAPSAS